MIRRLSSIACVALLLVLSFSVDAQHSVRPKNGFVPDERTAIAIAEAVLIPIYGEEHIKSERPFKATLKGGTWHIEGYLPEGLVGGVAEVRISKADARIIHVTHGR